MFVSSVFIFVWPSQVVVVNVIVLPRIDSEFNLFAFPGCLYIQMMAGNKRTTSLNALGKYSNHTDTSLEV